MEIVFSVFLSMFVIDCVLGVDPDGVKTVIEGDSLTLQTDFTEMQKDGLTEWKVNNTNIATINKGTGKVEYSDDKLMMMFSGRLNLDQTGFLTIWNIRIKHSGEYKVESVSSVGTKSKMFKVIVKESPLKSVEDKDEIKVLSATKGNSETLHTETELQKHDLILWRFGAEGSLIAKGDKEDNHISYYDGDDGRFRGRLELDSKTGSLTITDLETKYTGEFRLKIISDRRILFKRFTVTVSVLGLSPGAEAAICVVILLVAAAAVAAGVVMYFRSDYYKVKKLMCAAEINDQLKQLPKIFKQLEQLMKVTERLSENSEKKLPEGCENKILKISEKLTKMSEGCKEELPKISEQLEQLREKKISEQLSKISEKLKKMCAAVTDEDKKSEQLHNVETCKQETRSGGNSLTELKELKEDDVETSEQETRITTDTASAKYDDVTQEDTPRSEIREDMTDDVKISEQDACADVTQEETVRPEIKEGERERYIYVQETAISKAFGADKRLRDRQGKKRLVLCKTNTEDAGVQTQGTDGKAPENELKELKEESTGKELNEETPFMSQQEEDGPNE